MKADNELNFFIEKVIIDDIISNPNLLLELLNTAIYDKIEQYIIDNLSTRDGGPNLSNMRILNFSYNKDNNKGKFRLSFVINRFYCCSDVEASNTDYIDLDFYLENGSLFAKTEYLVWELNN